MIDQEETPEQSEPEQESEPGSKPKQIRVKRRNPLVQLQQCADELSELASKDGVKSNNKVDALIRKADILTELARLTAKERESEALADDETLTAQHEQDAARIAELEAEVTSLKASQRPVEVRTIPDPEAPQLRADLKLRDEMLAAVASAVTTVLSHPQRINFAAVLVTKYGRASQSFLNQVTDFSLIWCASQKRDEELQELISLAQPNARGDNCLVSRALLAARGVPVIGPQAKRPVYGDIFTELDGQ